MLTRLLAANSVPSWLIAAVVAVVSYLVLRIALAIVHNRLAALAKRTSFQWDDIVVAMLERTKGLFLAIAALYFGATFLTLPHRWEAVVRGVAVVALLIQSGIWVSTGFTAWLTGYTQRVLQADRSSATTMSALGFIVKLALWSLILLVALDNLGFNIRTLIAGLGVGGVAVALAVQNILGDLFASLSIVLDKPFVLGDFLIVDDHLGTVERIGLKTTRLRSLGGEQLIFSNSDLLKARLHNYGRMFERRVVFSVGVTYQTPRAKLELIPTIIREAIQAQEKTRFDRSHLKEFGDFSINFESVYYVLGPDYNLYMNIQQAINLQIHKRFEEEGIEFAYPTQTLFVVRQGQ
jgi:small-conductance mechanosensitive channel